MTMYTMTTLNTNNWLKVVQLIFSPCVQTDTPKAHGNIVALKQ